MQAKTGNYSMFIISVVDLITPHLYISYEMATKILQYIHTEAISHDPSAFFLFAEIMGSLAKLTPTSEISPYLQPYSKVQKSVVITINV